MFKVYPFALVLIFLFQLPAEARDYTQAFLCQSTINGTVFDATWFMPRKPKNAPKDAVHAHYKKGQDFLAIRFIGERAFTYTEGVWMGFRLGTEFSFELKVTDKSPTLLKRIGKLSYCTTRGGIVDQGLPLIR